ncbi:MAG: hypothetical protein CVU09_14485 [Bacteroidetes bacterium HGW-Bacteroidetes-4]|jgi:hypothetical protein|nr:MAG: hypothetical protein CVU09_14485 [Bacteroidetes bacterium HGW-Bacteroidetes-4]
MKRSGVLVTIVSLALFAAFVISKWNHWPGASILLLISILSGALVLLSLIKKATALPASHSSRMFLLLGGASFLVFTISVLFTILHWPYAVTMQILASLALIVLILLCISDAWNEKDDTRRIKKVFIAYAIGIMALLSIFIR